MEKIYPIIKALANYLKGPSIPKFPNPREYWTCKGYEPFSWSFLDIELAIEAGWTEIVFHDKDEYPYLEGTVSGIDPEYGFSFYLPKYAQWIGCLEYR